MQNFGFNRLIGSTESSKTPTSASFDKIVESEDFTIDHNSEARV